MAEWHLPPDYIVDNWTDELLELMIEKMVERKYGTDSPPKLNSEGELFAKAKNLVKVVKRGG